MALTNNYQQAARFSVCCELCIHDVFASAWVVIEQELTPCLAHSKLRIQQKLKYGNWIVTRMPTPTLSDEAGTSACDQTTTCHHSQNRNKFNQAMLTFDGLLTQAKFQLLPQTKLLTSKGLCGCSGGSRRGGCRGAEQQRPSQKEGHCLLEGSPRSSSRKAGSSGRKMLRWL